jgi:hypothetical protein
MIQVYGQGRPGDLGKPLFHHARGVLEAATAVLAGLWAHELHTNLTRTHKMHFGKGANGVNLYLDNGEQFAFRGVGSPGGGYDRILVHRGSVRPLGPAVLELRRPEDSAALWAVLSEAAQGGRVRPA